MNAERVEKGAKVLKDLKIGDHVYVQDQYGNTPRKWTKSGIIVEKSGCDSFIVKIDGSGSVTRRNRQFLRHFTPFPVEKVSAIVYDSSMDRSEQNEALSALLDSFR